MRLRRVLAAFSLLVFSQAQPGLPADTVDASLYQDLRYRLIGPFRASRTVGGVGIPSQPNVFFAGVHSGGVWKTDDYGRTWKPIFDDTPASSVGSLAVAPSDPNVVWAGTGETF